MKNLIIFLILILLSKFAYAKENLVLKGYWFECEFSEKTVPPNDQCEMLDDDGFNFKGNVAINVEIFFTLIATFPLKLSLIHI